MGHWVSTYGTSITITNNKWQSMVGDAAVLTNTFKTHYLDKKSKSKDQNPRLDLNKKYHDW